MANTERMNALRQVAEARKTIGDARKDTTLSDSQQHLLDDLYQELMDTEDTLIHEDIQESIDRLNQHAESLKDLTSRLNRRRDELKKYAETISTIARVIGTLADIVAKAASAGLL